MARCYILLVRYVVSSYKGSLVVHTELNREERVAKRSPSWARSTQAVRYKCAFASGCLGDKKWQWCGLTETPVWAVYVVVFLSLWMQTNSIIDIPSLPSYAKYTSLSLWFCKLLWFAQTSMGSLKRPRSSQPKHGTCSSLLQWYTVITRNEIHLSPGCCRSVLRMELLVYFMYCWPSQLSRLFSWS